MGLAIIEYEHATLYEVKFPKKPTTIQILQRTREVLRYILASHELPIIACIEGAAHGAGFVQAKLAESKSASAMALLDMQIEIIIKPPLTIYKKVFGSGKIKSKEYKPWSMIPKNAASALGCAIFASKYKEKENDLQIPS
jgi:hypothetical protein